MEWWNNGMMGPNSTATCLSVSSHFSNIPVFRHKLIFNHIIHYCIKSMIPGAFLKFRHQNESKSFSNQVGLGSNRSLQGEMTGDRLDFLPFDENLNPFDLGKVGGEGVDNGVDRHDLR